MLRNYHIRGYMGIYRYYMGVIQGHTGINLVHVGVIVPPFVDRLEYGVYRDLFTIPKAIFYLLKGDYRGLGLGAQGMTRRLLVGQGSYNLPSTCGNSPSMNLSTRKLLYLYGWLSKLWSFFGS